MIRADKLRAAYGLHDASFGMDHGLVALVGPNGSGKTTLIKALAGLLPVKGELIVEGRTAYLPQSMDYLPTMRVSDVVALGRAPYRGRLSRLSDADSAAVDDALQSTGTTPFADRPVGDLSGGERARVGLARALATQAPILLADEPTASLDMRHALDMMERLQAAARDSLVVCAVHDLPLAARYADRVLVMEDGKLVADGGPDTLHTDVVERVFGISPPAGGWQTATRTAKPRP